MTPEQIAARHRPMLVGVPGHVDECDACALLAHIDTLTAAVEKLTLYDKDAVTMAQAAESMKRRVLAILNGETPTPAR